MCTPVSGWLFDVAEIGKHWLSSESLDDFTSSHRRPFCRVPYTFYGYNTDSHNRHVNLSTILDNVSQRQTKTFVKFYYNTKIRNLLITRMHFKVWNTESIKYVHSLLLGFIYNFLSHYFEVWNNTSTSITCWDKYALFSLKNLLLIGIREENVITSNDSHRYVLRYLLTRLIFRFGGLNCTIVFAIIKSDWFSKLIRI